MHKQVLTAVCAVALCSASASFDVFASGRFAKPDLSTRTSTDAPMKSTAGLGHPPVTTPICIPPAGKTSNGDYFTNDPGNSVVLLNIGVGNAMTGASVDASIEAFAPSLLSNSMILFSSTNFDTPNGIIFLLGHTDGPGFEEVSTGGILRPRDDGYPDVATGADGILRLEWSDRDLWGSNVHLNPNAVWSNAASPVVCQGVYITCTNQSACDAAVLAVGGVAGPPVAATPLPMIGKLAIGLLIAGLGFVVFRRRNQFLRGN